MDLTVLNTAKASLESAMVNAGVMPVDTQKYYIPLDEVLVIFTEVASILTELEGRIANIEAQME